MTEHRTSESEGGFLNCLCGRLKEAFGDNLCSVVLFGSQARRTARPDSDIDIMLVLKDLPSSRLERHEKVARITDNVRAQFDRPLLSQILLTVEEMRKHPRVLLDMVEDARILLDDGTFKRELTALKKRMKELGSRRVFLDDGTWYWVLKPGMRLGETIRL